MKKSDTMQAIGLTIGAIGLIAQLFAPNCPKCGAKLIVIRNYCINCKVVWRDMRSA